MKISDMFRDWKDTVQYKAQAVICSEGEPADVLYFILSGEVELTLRGTLLGIEKASGIIGEMSLIDAATCCVTSKALTDVELARLDRDQLTLLSSQNPEFSLHVMAALANRLRAVDGYISGRIQESLI
jgi:CRP/FNR family cyclic AMP-dependent transcriptional regulator